MEGRGTKTGTKGALPLWLPATRRSEEFERERHVARDRKSLLTERLKFSSPRNFASLKAGSASRFSLCLILGSREGNEKEKEKEKGGGRERERRGIVPAPSFTRRIVSRVCFNYVNLGMS